MDRMEGGRKRHIAAALAAGIEAASPSGALAAKPDMQMAQQLPELSREQRAKIEEQVQQNSIRRWKVDIEEVQKENPEVFDWIASDSEDGMEAQISRLSKKMIGIEGQKYENARGVIESLRKESKELIQKRDRFQAAFRAAEESNVYKDWARAWEASQDLRFARIKFSFTRGYFEGQLPDPQESRRRKSTPKEDYPQKK